MTTRRNILKGGAGLAAILASGKAPAYLVKSMLAAHNSIGMRVGGAKLPYDAEVEYLESTGTQWIDTGVIALADDSYDLDFWMASLNNSQTLFGAANDGARLATVWVTLGGAIRFGGGGTIAFDGSIWKVGDWNSLHSSYSTTILNGVSKVNSFPHPFKDTVSTQNILLFKANGMPQSTIKIRISNLRWYRNGVLVRDLISVRLGTEGAMYDRVSGQLFRNQGTGAFLWGSDASAQNGGV